MKLAAFDAAAVCLWFSPFDGGRDRGKGLIYGKALWRVWNWQALSGLFIARDCRRVDRLERLLPRLRRKCMHAIRVQTTRSPTKYTRTHDAHEAHTRHLNEHIIHIKWPERTTRAANDRRFSTIYCAHAFHHINFIKRRKKKYEEKSTKHTLKIVRGEIKLFLFCFIVENYAQRASIGVFSSGKRLSTITTKPNGIQVFNYKIITSSWRIEVFLLLCCSAVCFVFLFPDRKIDA